MTNSWQLTSLLIPSPWQKILAMVEVGRLAPTQSGCWKTHRQKIRATTTCRNATKIAVVQSKCWNNCQCNSTNFKDDCHSRYKMYKSQTLQISTDLCSIFEIGLSICWVDGSAPGGLFLDRGAAYPRSRAKQALSGGNDYNSYNLWEVPSGYD